MALFEKNTMKLWNPLAWVKDEGEVCVRAERLIWPILDDEQYTKCGPQMCVIEKERSTRELDNLGGCDQQGCYVGLYVEDTASEGQIWQASQSSESAPLLLLHFTLGSSHNRLRLYNACFMKKKESSVQEK